MAYPDIKNKDKDKYIESDIVKHFTIPDKLRNSDHDIKCITLKVIESQKVTRKCSQSLQCFSQRNEMPPKKNKYKYKKLTSLLPNNYDAVEASVCL